MPAALSREWRYAAFAVNCSRRSGSFVTIDRLSSIASARPGEGAVENTNGLARCTRYSIAHDGPATNAPLTPKAFAALLTEMHAFASTPADSSRPLPRSP